MDFIKYACRNIVFSSVIKDSYLKYLVKIREQESYCYSLCLSVCLAVLLYLSASFHMDVIIFISQFNDFWLQVAKYKNCKQNKSLKRYRSYYMWHLAFSISAATLYLFLSEKTHRHYTTTWLLLIICSKHYTLFLLFYIKIELLYMLFFHLNNDSSLLLRILLHLLLQV